MRTGIKDYTVAAILWSDLHFSSKAPLARSCEEDWFLTQKNYIDQVRKLANSYRNVPIICSGDVLDKAISSPELTNFLLEHLPFMYSVAGNHDIPYHQYSDIKRSSFYTLVKAGKICLIEPGKPLTVGALRLHGFPWSFPVQPCKDKHSMLMEIGVVHCYLWVNGKSYPNAPKEKRLGHVLQDLQGYDAVLYGDNHITIGYNLDKTKPAPSVFNPGSFMRRKSDEKGHRPCVGLLYEDGKIKKHYLNVDSDKFLKVESDSNSGEMFDAIGMNGFIEELCNLGSSAIDFSEAIKQTLERNKVPESVKKIILKAMEK